MLVTARREYFVMEYEKRDPLEPPENPTHKLQLYIPEELFFELGKIFPHGMRRPVFQTLAEDILQKMKDSSNPDAVCAAILKGDLRLEYREQK